MKTVLKTALKNLGPKQRIIETAVDLFYAQGYLATGINQIIEEASVSKASFYDHFKSKEDLCIAYLHERHNIFSGLLKEKISEYEAPLDKFLAPLAFLEYWMPECSYRGCAFLNIVSEITDVQSNVRKEVIYTKDGFKSVIRELTKDLKKSDAKYKNLDVEFITNAYYVLIEGAITASQIYGETWPVEETRKAIKKLICKE